MKREYLLPLIVGLILGLLIMIFWQFTTRLNVQQNRVSQLEQVTGQNSKTLNSIVSFINQSTGKTKTGSANGAK